MNDTQKSEKGTVVLNSEQCKGCGLCVASCSFHVLSLSDSLNRYGFHPAVYAGRGCTGCGLCFYACPEPAAITVYRTPVRRVVVPRMAA